MDIYIYLADSAIGFSESCTAVFCWYDPLSLHGIKRCWRKFRDGKNVGVRTFEQSFLNLSLSPWRKAWPHLVCMIPSTHQAQVIRSSRRNKRSRHLRWMGFGPLWWCESRALTASAMGSANLAERFRIRELESRCSLSFVVIPLAMPSP